MVHCPPRGFVVAILVVFRSISGYEIVPACNSEIYCHGKLLETVQTSGLFRDSKTFVDMKLRYSPETILENFESLKRNGSLGSKARLRTFVKTSFERPGTEFETWEPTDYVEIPQFLHGVKDRELRTFGKSLCSIWKVLGRKIKQDVRDSADRYSLLYVPHPFVVPGGRFREAYYWDSYWVIKGLLLCEMNTTAKGMLLNFLDIVNRFGFVPNGLRVYYSRRSQPPFLTPMVESYYRATGDVTFLKESLPLLEKEYNFWMTNRTTFINKGGKLHVLNKYGTLTNSPRPESYKEDKDTAADLQTEEEKASLYSNLASAAESGWDFSSRWFKSDAPSKLNLSSTVIKDLVPVDLNSILCMTERLLAKFYNITGNRAKATEFHGKFEKRKNDIKDVFWNEIQGVWQDYYEPTASHRNYFFPSNVFPLFAECAGDPEHDKRWYEIQVLTYLKSRIVLDFAGGIPTSLVNSGQQWDYPNVWPPLQHVLVTTLATGALAESREIARDLAQKYVYSNWKGWKKTGHMFEKYDVNRVGGRGGGGEYGVQTGFGWSNGVLLDFLRRYGHDLTTSNQSDDTNVLGLQ